jgi:hypothetical protein
MKSLKLHTTNHRMSDSQGLCCTCATVHDWEFEEHLECVPPLNVLRFGDYLIPRAYRDALHAFSGIYITEEVVGSFLGHNPHFPSWLAWEAV